MAKEFNDSNFQNEVLSSDKLTVLIFGLSGVVLAVLLGPLSRISPRNTMVK